MNEKTKLFYAMNGIYDYAVRSDTPDGATDQMVRDTVALFNDQNGTDFDPHDTWLEWLQWEKCSAQTRLAGTAPGPMPRPEASYPGKGEPMPKMICCNCQVEYRPDRNGVVVIDMFQKPPQPYKLYEADRWICPGCGHKVVAGFGQRYAEHFQDGFAEQLAAALRKPHVYNFERVGDAKAHPMPGD